MNGLRENCSRVSEGGARGNEVPVNLDFTYAADPGIELGWEAGIRAHSGEPQARRMRLKT
jgi:hypothetical protein